MTLNSDDFYFNDLSKLKLAFDNFRSTMTNNKIAYSEKLKILAVSALKYFSFNEVYKSCHISPSSLFKWKNELHKKAMKLPRRLSVINNEGSSPFSCCERNKDEAILKCPNGLEIKIQQSFVPELLTLCGGLKQC